MMKIFLILFFGFTFSQPSFSWDNHDQITKESLVSYQNWKSVSYKPIEDLVQELVHPLLGEKISNLKELIQILEIQGSKINWQWQPSEPLGLEIVSYSTLEADHGMDQDLDLGSDQKYMGGKTGLSSQALRHMYYQPFDWSRPLETFHFPFHEMGTAPDRAELYFKFAVQLKQKNEMFWAYRFLGWGLHYIQDLTQPYHASQFASFKLLPLSLLVTKDWDSFVQESTRVVANFHLAFEDYALKFFKNDIDIPDQNEVMISFQAATGNAKLKLKLEQDKKSPIKETAKNIAKVSATLASDLFDAQDRLMGPILFDASTDFLKQKIIDLTPYVREGLRRKAQQKLNLKIIECFSNVGVATRWYLTRFDEG